MYTDTYKHTHLHVYTRAHTHMHTYVWQSQYLDPGNLVYPLLTTVTCCFSKWSDSTPNPYVLLLRKGNGWQPAFVNFLVSAGLLTCYLINAYISPVK